MLNRVIHWIDNAADIVTTTQILTKMWNLHILVLKNMSFWAVLKNIRSTICFISIECMMLCQWHFLRTFYGPKWMFLQYKDGTKINFHEMRKWNWKKVKKTKPFSHVGWPMLSICWPKVNKCWLFSESDSKMFKNVIELFPD